MTSRISICLRAGVLAGLLSLGLTASAWADGSRPLVVAQGLFPPATVPDGDQSEGASDPSNFAIRIARLEDELRRAYGMIEELQNDNQRLEAELKRFREDVEFRLGGPKAPVAAAPTLAPTVAAVQPTPEAPKPRKGDAFDPNADPDAVGAPHPLGSTAPSAPLSNGLEFKPGARPPSEPMDIGPHPTTAPPPSSRRRRRRRRSPRNRARW